jgi:uncharacterized protein YpmS
MDGASNKGTEHVQSWIKKLKESQDRKKDEKIRRYNDVVSRLIILLIGVCIVCVIVIAALIVQNEGQRKNINELVQINNTTFMNGLKENQTTFDREQILIRSMQSQIDFYKATDISHRVNVYDPKLPNLTAMAYNKSQITLYFADGTSETAEFTGADIRL